MDGLFQQSLLYDLIFVQNVDSYGEYKFVKMRFINIIIGDIQIGCVCSKTQKLALNSAIVKFKIYDSFCETFNIKKYSYYYDLYDYTRLDLLTYYYGTFNKYQFKEPKLFVNGLDRLTYNINTTLMKYREKCLSIPEGSIMVICHDRFLSKCPEILQISVVEYNDKVRVKLIWTVIKEIIIPHASGLKMIIVEINNSYYVIDTSVDFDLSALEIYTDGDWKSHIIRHFQLDESRFQKTKAALFY